MKLDKEYNNRLKEISEELLISKSNLVRNIVSSYLDFDEEERGKKMEFDDGLSNFKYLKMRNLLNRMVVNVKGIKSVPFYVFPIGNQYNCEETQMRTEMILTDNDIGFVGMGKKGDILLYDFDAISGMKQEDNELKIIFYEGLSKLILELPDDIYAILLCEMIDLGRKGLNHEQITQKMLIDECMVD